MQFILQNIPSSALRVSDVKLTKNGYKFRVVIRESKTDQ